MQFNPDYLISQGIFCVLFVWLLVDTQKKNAEREKAYQGIINNLSDKLSVVEGIKETVDKMETKLDAVVKG